MSAKNVEPPLGPKQTMAFQIMAKKSTTKSTVFSQQTSNGSHLRIGTSRCWLCCSWESWGKMPPAGCVPRESDDKPVLFEPMMKSVLLVRVVTSVPSRHFCIPTSFWGCLLIWDVLRRGIQENDPKHLPWEKPCGFQNITFGLIYWNMHGSCFKGTPQSVPKRLASQT